MMNSWWTVWGNLFWISGNPESDKRDDEDVQCVLWASEIYCLLRQFLWRQMTAERRLLTNDPLCQIYLSIYSLAPLLSQISSLSLSDLANISIYFIPTLSVWFIFPCIHLLFFYLRLAPLSLSDWAKYIHIFNCHPLCQIYLSIYSLAPLLSQISSLSLSDSDSSKHSYIRVYILLLSNHPLCLRVKWLSLSKYFDRLHSST